MTMTLEFAIKIHSVSRWFVVMGDEQKTLTFTVFWLGAWHSGFLIHEATTIEPTSRLCSISSTLSWLLSSGEKEPSHGTNFITTWQVCVWIFTVLQMWVSKSLSLQYSWKWLARTLESNLSSIVLHSMNWSVLIGCPAVEITWFVSWSKALIHLLTLLCSEYAMWLPHSLGESAASLSNMI